jgi:putative ABC transport system permease protein
MSPRWIKPWRDAAAERGRLALMLIAVTVALAAVGAVLGAYAVLTREMAVNYLGTQPAHATLEMRGDVSAEVLAAARRHPAVAEAEARDVIPARARVGDEWRPVLLFAVDDFHALRISRFMPCSGEATPAPGSVLLEHTATGVLSAGQGSPLTLRMPLGRVQSVPVSGLVHDPGLAPAWQERAGYVYLDRAMLRQLGEDGSLHELRVRFRDTPENMPAIQAAAESLAQSLRRDGHDVLELRVPPPRQHPHQRQMTTVLFLLLAFSAMALLLAAVLVANTLAALLARQVREIGVMKTLGASTSQLVGVYLALVGLIGLAAAVMALPLGFAGTRVFSTQVGNLLNLTITQALPPWWVFAVQLAAALCVPIAVAAVPLWNACRVTVREAVDRHGAGGEGMRQWASRWPAAVRDVLRRPSRLALTLALLAAGGAMFMSALNVSRSWELTIDKVYETRHYDVEIRFRDAEPLARRDAVMKLPGVLHAEPWGYSTAAFARPGQIDVSRAYPDRGHGSFVVMAPPVDTRMIDFPLRAGRWLQPGDRDAVVLNHAAAAQQPKLKIGDPVLLSIGGHVGEWRLAGIVEEIGAAGVAYVNPDAFAQATGTQGRARMIRVATDATTGAERALRIRRAEAALDAAGADVASVQPLSELRTAMGDHIVILIRALVALACVMAAVGGLGLGSTLSIGVLERTRELAVMKTLGATRRRLISAVLTEAQLIALLSVVAAIVLALPLTALLDAMIGGLGFVAPLPFSVAPAAIVWWVLLVAAVSLGAAWLPARRAAGLRVAQALVQV